MVSAGIKIGPGGCLDIQDCLPSCSKPCGDCFMVPDKDYEDMEVEVQTPWLGDWEPDPTYPASNPEGVQWPGRECGCDVYMPGSVLAPWRSTSVDGLTREFFMPAQWFSMGSAQKVPYPPGGIAPPPLYYRLYCDAYYDTSAEAQAAGDARAAAILAEEDGSNGFKWAYSHAVYYVNTRVTLTCYDHPFSNGCALRVFRAIGDAFGRVWTTTGELLMDTVADGGALIDLTNTVEVPIVSSFINSGASGLPPAMRCIENYDELTFGGTSSTVVITNPGVMQPFRARFF